MKSRRPARRYSARTIARGAVATARAGRRIYKAFKSRGPQSIQQAPTTTQHEYKMVYKKRRMPPRKRKQWTRFVKKTNAVALKAAPLQTYVYTEGNFLNVLQDRTGNFYQGLYGINGTPRVVGTTLIQPLGGLNQISNLFNTFWTVAADRVGRSIYMESACMEISIRNLSSDSCIVEMYYISPKRDLDESLLGLNQTAVENVYNEAFTANETDLNTVGIGSFTPGTTPFNAPMFARHFQVTKKLRVQLGGAELYTTQIRNPKNYRISYSDAQKYSLKRGMAEGILFQVYGQPGLSGGAFSTPAQVKFSTSQVYNWRLTPTSGTTSLTA